MTMRLRAESARLEPVLATSRDAAKDEPRAKGANLSSSAFASWKELQDRVNDRGDGRSTFIAVVPPGTSKLDVDPPDARPPKIRGGDDDDRSIRDARPGHFGVDPGSGAIVERPDVRTLVWTSEDQERADRGWDWGVDPDTGRVVQQPNGARPAIWTSEDQERADRGWIYAVDPDTGDIVKVPTGPTPLNAE